jgi:hypothetical protein
MLVAFVSLRVFTLRLRGNRLHVSLNYLRYITKTTHQAPHLEFFTIHNHNYTFRHKRINENWIVCDEDEYSAPWEYVCVISKGSMFVHDLFFRYLHVHERKTDRTKSYKPADDATWNVAYVWEPCRCMMTIVLMVLTTSIPMAHHGLHLVDLGQLSGATDETCRRGQIPSTLCESF